MSHDKVRKLIVVLLPKLHAQAIASVKQYLDLAFCRNVKDLKATGMLQILAVKYLWSQEGN